VSKSIREMCIFSPHSAIKDPPFSQLDLISCRNLLIYMNAELQDRLVRTFHYALKPGGFLLLGPSEGLGRNSSLFSALDKKHRLYTRRNDGNAAAPIFPARRDAARSDAASRTVTATSRAGAEDMIERSARRALEKYAPAYVVIDASHNVLRFSGETGRYLGPSSGAASLNLFGLLHKGLRGAVRAAVQQAFAERRTVVQDGLTVTVDGQRQPLRLIAEPLPDGDLCVVAFNDVIERTPHAAATGSGDASAGGVGHAHLQQLEQELEITRTQLHSSIEQLETANEEMKSANEEYQSVNEELQSANEELETSKEEMQSINEELQTVNAELHSKNDTLLHLNSDLQNLLESTQIATMFLDTRLHVTNFTPPMTELFHLRDSDRGRPITDITARIQYPELHKDVKQVMRTLAVVERELRNPETGTIFLLRMRPYRTVDNMIDGVVLSFMDITDRKQQEYERGRLAAIVDSSKDAIIGHSLDGTITSWNAGAEFLFGYPTDRVLGQPLSMLLPPASVAHLGPLLSTCAQEQRTAETEMIWQRQDGAPMEVALTCSPVKDAAGRVISSSTIARDIGESARVGRALLASEQQLEAIIGQVAVGVAEVDRDGRFVVANARFCEIVGRSLKVLQTLRMLDITHPDDQAASTVLLQNLLGSGEPASIDKRYLRPDGATVWSNTNVSLLPDEGGHPRVLAVALDITHRTRAAQHRELMLGELNHRVKNSLASVQAIALQTLASAPSLEAFKEGFMARLMALSNTHNLLAEDAWSGVSLRQIVLNELAPYQQDEPARTEIVGAPLQLTPKIALALGMTLHELTTNAIKHGALSVPEGRVAVHWKTRRIKGQPWLRLHWSEHDGPRVAAPIRRGFGSRLIADGLAFELDGKVALEFDPAGVTCTIDVPLPQSEDWA